MATRTTGKTNERPTGLVPGIQHRVSETMTEIKKVTWPDKPTVQSLTILVIVMATLLGFLLFSIDFVFVRLWDWIPA